VGQGGKSGGRLNRTKKRKRKIRPDAVPQAGGGGVGSATTKALLDRGCRRVVSLGASGGVFGKSGSTGGENGGGSPLQI